MFSIHRGIKCVFRNNIGNIINYIFYFDCLKSSKVIFRQYSKISQKNYSNNNVNNSNVKSTFGQPTHQTHPHLIGNGEITPLITLAEYKKRRNLLLEAIIRHSSNRNDTYQNHLVRAIIINKVYLI